MIQSFQTIVKTRIIARHQQVVRVDRERLQPLSEEAQARCVEKVRELLPQFDAVIFEDYGKGLLQQNFVDNVTDLGERSRQIGNRRSQYAQSARSGAELPQ